MSVNIASREKWLRQSIVDKPTIRHLFLWYAIEGYPSRNFVTVCGFASVLVTKRWKSGLSDLWRMPIGKFREAGGIDSG